MNKPIRRSLFYRRSSSNVYRIFLWLLIIIAAGWFAYGSQRGTVRNPLAPTPTATRSAASFTLEGDAQFAAGKIDAAIEAYRRATEIDPNEAAAWSQLARIQTYSSELLTTDAAKRTRLQEALNSADQAAALAPEDSTVRAIRAFVLDWNAAWAGDGAQALLIQAEQEASAALTIDSNNTLALIFYAEILVDQQKWNQGEQYIDKALARNEELMDLHRVYAYVLEATGRYSQAIEEYDKAIALTPNLTFLYLRAGANYRILGFKSLEQNPDQDPAKNPLFLQSLDYFAKATRINAQLGVKDPIPYLSISKTYSQMGQYFIAARNVQKALSFKPAEADIYGQLGVIFFKSRNYEGSVLPLKCAIRGCTVEESCEARSGCDEGEVGAQITGLPLTDTTQVYYYTYGSVLAALSRPRDNKCPEALAIFAELRAVYPSDPVVIPIVQAGESICASLGQTTLEATATPADGSPTPTSLP